MTQKTRVKVPLDLIGDGGEAHLLRVQIACLAQNECDHLEDDGPTIFYEVPSDMMDRINDALGWLQGAKPC